MGRAFQARNLQLICNTRCAHGFCSRYASPGNTLPKGALTIESGAHNYRYLASDQIATMPQPSTLAVLTISRSSSCRLLQVLVLLKGEDVNVWSSFVKPRSMRPFTGRLSLRRNLDFDFLGNALQPHNHLRATRAQPASAASADAAKLALLMLMAKGHGNFAPRALPRNTELLHFVDQRGPLEAEPLGRAILASYHPVGFLKRLANVAALGVLQGIHARGRGRRHSLQFS